MTGQYKLLANFTAYSARYALSFLWNFIQRKMRRKPIFGSLSLKWHQILIFFRKKGHRKTKNKTKNTLTQQIDQQLQIFRTTHYFHLTSPNQDGKQPYGRWCNKTCLRGFPTKWESNRSPQLQRLARILKIRLLQVKIWYFPISE